MLTVKWANERDTYIHQTKKIHENNYGQVQWIDETGEFVDARSGTVWVMNDHGATVAKFDLGYGVSGPPKPLSEIDKAVAQAA